MRRRITGLNLLQRQYIVALSLPTTGCKREPVMPTAPLEPVSFKRGPGGRPTRQEAERRHHNLLAEAARLFLEKGWDGASVDEIARESGVAKRFIYARYPDKAALFAGAFERFIEEQIGTLHTFEAPPEDVEAGLRALGRRLLDLALRPEVLAFHRLLIAEAPRFPGLAKLFVERNRPRPLSEIIRVLAVYADRGVIQFSDPEPLAEQFFILVAGASQRMALLSGREEPAQEDRRLEAAVRLFLDGCRKA
jgi:TetR/AcrR family transcriptional repressor of mexJK operon